MMGIYCDFPAYIYGYTQSVLSNSKNPFSVLKNNSSSFSHHSIREGVAKDEWQTTHIHTTYNVADLLTKNLYGSEKQIKFIDMILHHIILFPSGD